MLYLLGLLFLLCFALFNDWKSSFTYTEKEGNHLTYCWAFGKITRSEYKEYMSNPSKYKPKPDHPFNRV